MSATTDIKELLSKAENSYILELEPAERLDKLQELLPHLKRKNISKSFLKIKNEVNNCKQDISNEIKTDTDKCKQNNNVTKKEMFTNTDNSKQNNNVTKKEMFTNTDNSKLQDIVIELKNEIELIKEKLTALEQVQQSDQQTIVSNDMITDILKIDLVGTARETFYLTDQNRSEIEQLYKNLNVSKSKLLNYIIDYFFSVLKEG